MIMDFNLVVVVNAVYLLVSIVTVWNEQDRKEIVRMEQVFNILVITYLDISSKLQVNIFNFEVDLSLVYIVVTHVEVAMIKVSWNELNGKHFHITDRISIVANLIQKIDISVVELVLMDVSVYIMEMKIEVDYFVFIATFVEN